MLKTSLDDGVVPSSFRNPLKAPGVTGCQVPKGILVFWM